MKLEPITADDLSWIFYEHVRSQTKTARSIAIAIVPAPVTGWVVLIPPRQNQMHKDIVAIVRKLERKLQSQYRLIL